MPNICNRTAYEKEGIVSFVDIPGSRVVTILRPSNEIIAKMDELQSDENMAQEKLEKAMQGQTEMKRLKDEQEKEEKRLQEIRRKQEKRRKEKEEREKEAKRLELHEQEMNRKEDREKEEKRLKDQQELEELQKEERRLITQTQKGCENSVNREPEKSSAARHRRKKLYDEKKKKETFAKKKTSLKGDIEVKVAAEESRAKLAREKLLEAEAERAALETEHKKAFFSYDASERRRLRENLIAATSKLEEAHKEAKLTRDEADRTAMRAQKVMDATTINCEKRGKEDAKQSEPEPPSGGVAKPVSEKSSLDREKASTAQELSPSLPIDTDILGQAHHIINDILNMPAENEEGGAGLPLEEVEKMLQAHVEEKASDPLGFSVIEGGALVGMKEINVEQALQQIGCEYIIRIIRNSWMHKFLDFFQHFPR